MTTIKEFKEKEEIKNPNIVKVITDFNDGVFVDYTVGEYVVKFENITNFHIGKDTHTYGPGYTDDYDMEILQWGKDTQGWLELYNVSKIYEPENGKSVIEYYDGKFNEIPEWLFKNKGNSTKISRFYYCNNIYNLLLLFLILPVFCTLLLVHKTFLILIIQRNIPLIHYLNYFLFLTYFELSSSLSIFLDMNNADTAILDHYEILNSHNSHFL